MTDLQAVRRAALIAALAAGTGAAATTSGGADQTSVIRESFITPTSASIAHRHRVSLIPAIPRRDMTDCSRGQRGTPTGIFSDGRPARWRLCSRRSSRGVSIRERIRPDYSRAHNNLGNVLAVQGRTDDALRHFHEAVRSDPDNAEARFSLARVHALRGDAAEAIRQLREVVRIRFESVPARDALACLLARGPEGATCF